MWPTLEPVSNRAVTVRRVLVGLGAVLVIALIAAAVVGISFARRPSPQVTGELELTGLSAPVSVLRDESGVPHIFGDSLTDLARAQGYVHAQERFFEMDVRRRVASGTLAALVGDGALTSDKTIRTMGWRRVAEAELPTLDPQTRQVLQAYADGVNAYLKGRSTSQVALEYAVLSVRVPVGSIPEWSPVDSLVWLRAMSWDLKANYRDELARARMAGRLTAAQIQAVYPPYPYLEHPAILSSQEWQPSSSGGQLGSAGEPLAEVTSPAAQRRYAAVEDALAAVPDLVGRGEGIGSNSWVVTGKHSATGKPILANDPHLATSQPGIWIQNSIQCRTVSASCPLSVSGFSLAGVPGVIIGHNQSIAWGMTNMAPDVSDFYLERIRDGQVQLDGAWSPVQTRSERIEVAGGDPVTITVRSTSHGPVLSDVLEPLAEAGRSAPVAGKGATDEDFAVSLAWTGLQPTTTADAILGLNLATNFSEFRAAAAKFAVPAQNLVYADTSGHIGYQAPGLIPVRISAVSGAPAGYWPAPGWDSSYSWRGFVKPADLPWVLDPTDEMIVTANQAVTQASRPFLTTDWDYGYRAKRITDLITGAGALTPAAMAQIQMDDTNLFADSLSAALVKIPLASDSFTREAQDLLRAGTSATPASGEGSAAAAYLNAVWQALTELTFDDDLPSGMRADGGARWRAAFAQMLEDPKSTWWDNKRTLTVVESRDEILRLALVQAREELTRKLGKDPATWEWGQLHQMTLKHAILGGDTTPGIVQWMVNNGPYAVSGGGAIVNATSWDAGTGFGVVAAPSMRMVVDLANLDGSTWISLSGVSGHPFNDHYADQTQDWVEGRQRPWRYSENAIREAGVDELTLKPMAAS